MHAFLHKSRRENHRRVVFTQQDTIYSRAHLVLTNLLITSLLVLCFSQWFLLFLPPKFLLISLSSYRFPFWYLLFRYRWAHHLCFLSMNDLSRSSFFDLSIYLPTPSLEGVLDSRRIYFYFQSFFKLPYKRNDVYIFFQIGVFSRIVSSTCKTPFQS